MIFEIPKAIVARLVSLTNRSERHGEDDVPAISMWFEAETDNTILDMLGDGNLRHAIYFGDDNQADVPGVPKTTPHLRCGSIDRIVVDQKPLEGWTLKVDHGIKEEDPVAFGGCKVDGFTAYPKARATVTLRWRVGTSDIDAESLGIIGMKVGQAVSVKMSAPKEKPPKTTDNGAPLFEGEGAKPAEPRKPGAAEKAAVAKVKGGDAPKAPHKSTKAEAKAAAEAAFKPGDTVNGASQVSPAGAWPFPNGGAGPQEAPPQSVVIERSQPGTRTARGRDRTAKALADGAAS